MGGKRKLHVGIRLPGFGIQAGGAPRAKLTRLFNDLFAEQGREGDDR